MLIVFCRRTSLQHRFEAKAGQLLTCHTTFKDRGNKAVAKVQGPASQHYAGSWVVGYNSPFSSLRGCSFQAWIYLTKVAVGRCVKSGEQVMLCSSFAVCTSVNSGMIDLADIDCFFH